MDFFWRFQKRIYLDYAAATPLHPKVAALMRPYERLNFANPSAIHQEGQEARRAVDAARQSIAHTLGNRAEGVIFTGSGTESNNLAILGYIKYLAREVGVPYKEMEVVTTRIEHPSVTELMPILEANGVTIKYVDVTKEGVVTKESLEKVLSKNTVLVTFAYANSEIGVIQPVAKLVRVVREAEKKYSIKISVHLDAAQAPLWLPCEMIRLGVDTMTLDAGKCFGPKGVGVLAIKNSPQLLPIMYGGGQESGLRPGTEAVSLVVGAAAAIKLAQATHKERSLSVSMVRDRAIKLLSEAKLNIELNGPKGDARLPNNINISLPGFDTEYAVVYLDKHGIAASTKSACAGAGGGESVVVKEISGDSNLARSTIRFTLGPDTKLSDFKKVAKVLGEFCQLMSTLTK